MTVIALKLDMKEIANRQWREHSPRFWWTNILPGL